MVTLYIILAINIVNILTNSKKGKAFKDFYKNLVSINFIVPGGGRHGARLAGEF